MTPRVLVAADVRLEHLLTASAEDCTWHGWTLAGAPVRALAQYDQAAMIVGSDQAGARACALLSSDSSPLVGKGRTPQTFRTSGPRLSLAPTRAITSRCPYCSYVHGVDRHNRPSISTQKADVLVTDSLRSDVVEFVVRSKPRFGAVAVLDDPAWLRFSSTSEIANRLRVIGTLVASRQFAVMLARRLRIEGDQLSASLGIDVRATAEPLGPINDDPWSDFLAEDPLEHALRSTLQERLATSFLPVPAPPVHRLPKPTRLSELQPRQRVCPLCGSRMTRARPAASVGEKSPVGVSHNLGWLRRRTLHAADKVDAVAAARRLLSWSGRAYVVASGGSAVAASYIGQLLRERTELFATETYPSDYAKIGVATDALVLVSYSGNTPDHVPVIRRAHELGVKRIALICHSPQPRLAPELGEGGLVVAYGNPRRPPRAERGFVSMAATVAPCALMLAALDSPAVLTPLATPRPREIESLGRALGDRLRDGYELHVLGSGYARPALLDLESKWVEGDLGPITVHQSKDFSHGRFMSVLGSGRRIVPLMLSVGPDPYETELMSTLIDEHRASAGSLAAPHLLASAQSGLLGSLELLLEVQEVAAEAGHAIGRDLSRPERIDPGGLRLYGWEGHNPRATSELLPTTRDDAPSA